MRPRTAKLLQKLQLGSYMLRIESGRASAIPITGESIQHFKKDILYRCGEGRRPTDLNDDGLFLVSIDRDHRLMEMVPMNPREGAGYILGVLGWM